MRAVPTNVWLPTQPRDSAKPLNICSAMIPEMKYSPGGLMLGGNGRPGFRRVLFVAPTGDDFAPGVSFDQTMAALVSNAKAGNFEVNLVVERRGA